MALTSSNVRVAVTGEMFVAPTGTAAPTSHTSTLNVAFKSLGYFNEDGVTETRDRSTTQHKAWQNAAVLREVVTDANLVYKFVMVETKKETVELYYGNTVTDADGSLTVVPAKTGGRKAFVLNIVDDTSLIRVWIPAGEITEVGDQVYANGEMIGYEVTVTAFPDASLTSGSDVGCAKKWYSPLIVP